MKQKLINILWFFLNNLDPYKFKRIEIDAHKIIIEVGKEFYRKGEWEHFTATIAMWVKDEREIQDIGIWKNGEIWKESVLSNTSKPDTKQTTELEEKILDLATDFPAEGEISLKIKEITSFIKANFISRKESEFMLETQKKELENDYKDICKRCRGKGYGTATEFASSKYANIKLGTMRFCECGRGQQLKNLIDKN